VEEAVEAAAAVRELEEASSIGWRSARERPREVEAAVEAAAGAATSSAPRRPPASYSSTIDKHIN